MNDREFSRADLEANRTWAALGYLVFFLPLWKCKDSKLGRYCANQGLLLMILTILVRSIFEIFTEVPLIGWLFAVTGNLVSLALVVVGLLCTIQLITNDRVIELPFIGFMRLIRP